MAGASAVAAIPGWMLLADDDEGIYRLRGERCTLWAGRRHHAALGDLEGLALDRRRASVWALAEESGEVVQIPLRGRRRQPVTLGRLSRPGRRENKGFEGLAYAPARLSPNGHDSLVAAHEAKPRRVSVFRLPDLRQTHEYKLSTDAKRALDDLADVALDPITGALLLLSEESRRIGVFEIIRECLELHDLVDVRVRHRERPEGLAFVTPHRLVVATEGPATLIEFRVERPA